MQKKSFYLLLKDYLDFNFLIIFSIFCLLFISFFYCILYLFINSIVYYIMDNSVFIFNLYDVVFKNYIDFFILYAITLNFLFYAKKLFFFD